MEPQIRPHLKVAYKKNPENPTAWASVAWDEADLALAWFFGGDPGATAVLRWDPGMVKNDCFKMV